MENVLSVTYLWLKAGHIIFVIFWIAGLFMLPRLFVYHQESEKGSAEETLWIERERRLLKIILLPSIIVVWVLGLVLAYQSGAMTQGWFHAKLLFVLLLSGFHGWCSAYARKLANGERSLSGKKLRFLNEIPGIITALVVVLVIIKPF